jgi:hypothetical protein
MVGAAFATEVSHSSRRVTKMYELKYSHGIFW